MKLYEIKSEIQRTLGYKATREMPDEETQRRLSEQGIDATHSSSIMYYYAAMAGDTKTMEDILVGKTDLEYIVEDCRK